MLNMWMSYQEQQQSGSIIGTICHGHNSMQGTWIIPFDSIAADQSQRKLRPTIGETGTHGP